MTRLSIELTEQQHQSIKALAALQGKSLKDYAVERLLPMTPDEEQAMAELRVLLAPRIERALRGEVSTKTVDKIFEEVLAEDEGRAV
jgi:Arc/MetJ-type ribon-helix-helix transcriptional regulator